MRGIGTSNGFMGSLFLYRAMEFFGGRQDAAGLASKGGTWTRTRFEALPPVAYWRGATVRRVCVGCGHDNELAA